MTKLCVNLERYCIKSSSGIAFLPVPIQLRALKGKKTAPYR